MFTFECEVDNWEMRQTPTDVEMVNKTGRNEADGQRLLDPSRSVISAHDRSENYSERE